MPRLDPNRAAEVTKAGEAGGRFALLPDGLYRAKLLDCTSETSKKGKAMWVWKFDLMERIDGPCKDADGNPIDLTERTMKYWTGLEDNVLFMLDAVFKAFDALPTDDTDDLVGDEVILSIDSSVITGGRSNGKMGNNVASVLSLAEGMPKPADFETVPPTGSPKVAADDKIPF